MDDSSSNIMQMLYYIIKESVQGQTEDKKYWLSKLKTDQDALREELANYIKELVKLTNEIAALDGSPDSSAAASFARAEAALQQFEAKLETSNLPYAEKKTLRTMVEQDHSFYRNARILEQDVRSDVLSSNHAVTRSSISNQSSQDQMDKAHQPASQIPRNSTSESDQSRQQSGQTVSNQPQSVTSGHLRRNFRDHPGIWRPLMYQ
jgi:predicted HNH restriction endonuclease